MYACTFGSDLCLFLFCFVFMYYCTCCVDCCNQGIIGKESLLSIAPHRMNESHLYTKTAVHGHRQASTETRSAAPAGVPTCPLQSPGGWRDAALPRAAIVMNYFLEAMMWICIIPWHLASLSTHYQCWVSGIFECMRLCVWVCARGIKYPSLTFSLAVHVVLQEEATRACQSWTAQHIFLVPPTMCVYLCVRLHMCVTVVVCFFVRQNWNTQLLRRRPATHAPTEGEGHVPLEYMEGRRWGRVRGRMERGMVMGKREAAVKGSR